MNKHDREQLTVRQKGLILMKSIMDYGMGTLWVSMGFFLLFTKYFSPRLQTQFEDPIMKIFGGVCVVYGIFRWYRGYKKNYLQER